MPAGAWSGSSGGSRRPSGRRARARRTMSQAIGGQAVLEGVMMRGPRNWAVAVRKPDGEIAQVAKEIDPLMARSRLLRLPVVRGVVALDRLSCTRRVGELRRTGGGRGGRGAGRDRPLDARLLVRDRDRVRADAVQGRACAAHRPAADLEWRLVRDR